MIKLSENSFVLLKSCLEKSGISLISIIESSNDKDFTIEFYNHLREIVSDELIAEDLIKILDLIHMELNLKN